MATRGRRGGGRGLGARRIGGSVLAAGIALAAWPLLRPADTFAGERAPAASATPPEERLVALGRRLFHDPSVSRSGKVACASCHDPEHGWSDSRTVSMDADGATRRHSQPVTDVGGAGFHWDGEFPAARDLIVARIGAPAEAMQASVARAVATASRAKEKGGIDLGREGSYGGHSPDVQAATGAQRDTAGPADIPTRVAADDRYAAAFRAAFGDGGVTSDRLVAAVDAFVGSLRTERNALDRHLAGDATALSPGAQRGLELFKGRANCASCHVVDAGADGRAALTDGRFHNTGVAFAPRPAQQGSPRRRGGIGFNGGGNRAGADLGRAERSAAFADSGAFKTASLRDVARRAPYMHDGSLATLADVVRYYAKGGTANPHLDPSIQAFGLSDADVADVVTFLESLSGDKRPGLLPARAAEKRVRVRVLDASGAAVKSAAIDVVPCGERLGDGPAEKIQQVTTSADGTAEIIFPQTTHVRLESDVFQVGYGRWVPDTTGDLDVVAAPIDRIVVVLRGDDLPERLDGDVADASGFANRVRFEGDRFVEMKLPAEIQSKVPPVRPAERFVFTRTRVLSAGEAMYVADVGTIRGRHFVRFQREDGRVVGAAIDLDGGASVPADLKPVHVQTVGLGDRGPLRDGAPK